MVRAIFFRIVEESLGTWIALAASAALFGLLHAFNPGATAVSTLAIALEAGVILAAAYVFTRRLWMAVGLHAAWNFTEGGIFGASVSGTHALRPVPQPASTARPLLSGGAFGPEASIVAVLVCLTAGIALLARAHRRGRFIRPFWSRTASTAGEVDAEADRLRWYRRRRRIHVAAAICARSGPLLPPGAFSLALALAYSLALALADYVAPVDVVVDANANANVQANANANENANRFNACLAASAGATAPSRPTSCATLRARASAPSNV